MLKSKINKAIRWKAQKRHKVAFIALSLIWVLFAGFSHYLMGPQYEFHLVFLIPVITVCWFVGLRSGSLMTLISGTVWMIADWLHASDIEVLLLNESVRLSVFFLVVFLVDRFRSALDRESILARVDALTQLPNRRDFYETAGLEVERSRRYEHPLTIISLDLDNFKSVNDCGGHDAGDLVLRIVADVLRTNIRSVDVAARVGGDEFVILLPETGPEAAEEFTAKLQQKLAQAMQNAGWPVTGSFGVAIFFTAPKGVDELIKRSDILLYCAKQKGKNVICLEVFRS